MKAKCQPKVKFSTEVRQVTPDQIEAGKRLFSRLIARDQNNGNSAKARAQAGAEAPPAEIKSPPH